MFTLKFDIISNTDTIISNQTGEDIVPKGEFVTTQENTATVGSHCYRVRRVRDNRIVATFSMEDGDGRLNVTGCLAVATGLSEDYPFKWTQMLDILHHIKKHWGRE